MVLDWRQRWLRTLANRWEFWHNSLLTPLLGGLILDFLRTESWGGHEDAGLGRMREQQVAILLEHRFVWSSQSAMKAKILETAAGMLQHRRTFLAASRVLGLVTTAGDLGRKFLRSPIAVGRRISVVFRQWGRQLDARSWPTLGQRRCQLRRHLLCVRLHELAPKMHLVLRGYLLRANTLAAT